MKPNEKLSQIQPGEVTAKTPEESATTIEEELSGLNFLIQKIDTASYYKDPKEFFQTWSQIETLVSDIVMRIGFLGKSIDYHNPYHNKITLLVNLLFKLVYPLSQKFQEMRESNREREVLYSMQTELRNQIEKNRSQLEEIRWSIILTERIDDQGLVKYWQELRASITLLEADLELLDSQGEKDHILMRSINKRHALYIKEEDIDLDNLMHALQAKLNLTRIELKQIQEEEWNALKALAILK